MSRGMPADLDAGNCEAFRLYRADIVAYEAEVLRAVKVPLKPHEFDALVSFHYNTGGIAKASQTRHLNAGRRAPRSAHPVVLAMLVLMDVSLARTFGPSINANLVSMLRMLRMKGWRWPIRVRRASATSGRFCRAARKSFFVCQA
jgi:hypothetical protein